MGGAEFDWDLGNRQKCQKHGISIEEIEAFFLNGPRVAPDVRHSHTEDRFIATGRGASGRPMFVAFVYRMRSGSVVIRPVSARYMHKAEARRYEESTET